MAYPIVEVSSVPLVTRVDEASGTVTYIGYALAGATTADSVWQIKRMTVSGVQTTIQFASGSTMFNYVWDDRASLTYS